MRIAYVATLLAALLLGCSAAGDVRSGMPSESPRATHSPAPTQPAATNTAETPTANQSASASALSADPGFARGSMAAIITTDLVVRSAPGTGADSEIQPATLSAPSIVYVIDGPVVADGYAWYLVDPVVVSWAPSDLPTAGWVAAGGKDGEDWIGRHESECDDDPTLEGLVGLPPQVRLYCYSRRTLALDGVIYGCGMGILGPRIWPWEGECLLFSPGQGPQSAPPSCADCSVPRLRVWFDGLSLPASGATVSAIGHFDDPAAQDCRTLRGDVTPLSVYECRLGFVAASLGPP